MPQDLIDSAAALPTLNVRNGNIEVYSNDGSSEVRIKVEPAENDIRLESFYRTSELQDGTPETTDHRTAVVLVFGTEDRQRGINVETIALNNTLRLTKAFKKMLPRDDEL
jgi:hypothetical protein